MLPGSSVQGSLPSADAHPVLADVNYVANWLKGQPSITRAMVCGEPALFKPPAASLPVRPAAPLPAAPLPAVRPAAPIGKSAAPLPAATAAQRPPPPAPPPPPPAPPPARPAAAAQRSVFVSPPPARPAAAAQRSVFVPPPPPPPAARPAARPAATATQRTPPFVPQAMLSRPRAQSPPAVPPVAIAQPTACSLINPNILCYMNSSIQLLYFIDEFRTAILNARDSHNPYIQAMRVLFLCMINAPNIPPTSLPPSWGIRPYKLMDPVLTHITLELDDKREGVAQVSIRAILSTLLEKMGHQEDASEFIIGLFKVMNYQDDDSFLQEPTYYRADRGNNINILKNLTLELNIETICLYGGEKKPIKKVKNQTIIIKKGNPAYDWENEVDVQTLLSSVSNTMRDPSTWVDGCIVDKNGFNKGPTQEVETYEITPDTTSVIIIIQPHTEQTNTVNYRRTIIRDAYPVKLNKSITISNVTFILNGYIVHEGSTINSGHYVYIKCDDDGNPSKIINDANITEVKGDTYKIPTRYDGQRAIPFHDEEHQQLYTYIASYKKLRKATTDELELVTEILGENTGRDNAEILESNAELQKPGVIAQIKVEIMRTSIDNTFKDIFRKLRCYDPVHGAQFGYQRNHGIFITRAYNKKIPPPGDVLYPYLDKDIIPLYNMIKDNKKGLANLLIKYYGLTPNDTITFDCIPKAAAAVSKVKVTLAGTIESERFNYLMDYLKTKGVKPRSDDDILAQMRDLQITATNRSAIENEGLVTLDKPKRSAFLEAAPNASDVLTAEEMAALGYHGGRYRKTRSKRRSSKRKSRSKARRTR